MKTDKNTPIMVNEAAFANLKVDPAPKRAAVSLVYRYDGRLLAVWNRRYGCWTFPGGMVEEGETSAEAQARELSEETGLVTASATLIWSGPVDGRDLSRAAICDVYDVRVEMLADARTQLLDIYPREMEPGCPVTWFTRDEFLKWCDFRDFYRHMWEQLAAEERAADVARVIDP